MVLVIDDGKVRSTRRLIDGGWAIEMEMECLKDGTTATMVFSLEDTDATGGVGQDVGQTEATAGGAAPAVTVASSKSPAK